MSDHETPTLTIRLNRLADELAPSADPVAQVRAARTRHRRQRRNRIAAGGLVAAAAVLGLVVPAAVGSFSAEPGRGEVAGPDQIPPEKTPGPPPEGEDARKADRWTDVLDERAEREERLSAVADGLRAALEARPVTLSLTAPEAFGRCPAWAPALSSSLGIPLEEQRGPVGSGPLCLWSGFPEDEDLLVQLEYATEVTREQMHEEVDREVAQGDCYPTALPGTASPSALALCEEHERTTWRMHLMDTGESVVWTLTVSVSDRHPGDDVQTVMAAVELLDASW